MNPGTRPSVGTILQLRKTVKNSEARAYHRIAPVKDDLNDSEGEQIKVDIDL
jgi:hypothetical protein